MVAWADFDAVNADGCSGRCDRCAHPFGWLRESADQEDGAEHGSAVYVGRTLNSVLGLAGEARPSFAGVRDGGAQATALAVFMARRGASKEEIRTDLAGRFGYNLRRTVDQIRPDYRWDVSCQGSSPKRSWHSWILRVSRRPSDWLSRWRRRRHAGANRGRHRRGVLRIRARIHRRRRVGTFACKVHRSN